MINLFSYLITILAFMFWAFRIVVAFTNSMGMEFAVLPLNMEVEVLLLFVTLISLVLVIKRKIVGAIFYVATYAAYFGVDVYNIFMRIQAGEAGLTNYAGFMSSFIAIILAFLVLIDMLLNKERKGNVKNKKTDWFYEKGNYEREFDERADKNQYRINK